MIDPRDEQQLLGGGDTMLHYHNLDRIPTHDTLEQLHQVATLVAVTGNVQLEPQDDFVLADTTLFSTTVQLLPAKAGQEVEIIKVTPGNRVLILPTPPDSILGEDGYILTTQWDALRLKAIEGFGWVAI